MYIHVVINMHVHTQDPDSQLLYAQNLFCSQLQNKTSQNQYKFDTFHCVKNALQKILKVKIAS